MCHGTGRGGRNAVGLRIKREPREELNGAGRREFVDRNRRFPGGEMGLQSARFFLAGGSVSLKGLTGDEEDEQRREEMNFIHSLRARV